MRDIKLIILLASFFLAFSTYGQDLKVKPKFFSLRNSKLSMGIGFEGSLPSFMLNTSAPKDMKVKYEETENSDEYPYLSGGITFDIFSDNSIIGLLASVNYSFNKTIYQKEDVAKDVINVERIEVPVYLKFRPGEVGGKDHLWLLFGAIYSLPMKIERNYERLAYSNNNALRNYTDQDLSQASTVVYASTSVGYEGYFSSSKSTRAALFVTASYPLVNQLNANYAEFKQGGTSVFSNYPDFDAREIRISLGIKILYKLSKSKL